MDKQTEAEKQGVWERPLPPDGQPEPDPDLPTTSDLLMPKEPAKTNLSAFAINQRSSSFKHDSCEEKYDRFCRW